MFNNWKDEDAVKWDEKGCVIGTVSGHQFKELRFPFWTLLS